MNLVVSVGLQVLVSGFLWVTWISKVVSYPTIREKDEFYVLTSII